MAPKMKAAPMDPRMEVANELKSHLLSLALTHRKALAAATAGDPAKKKKPKKPGEEEPGEEHEDPAEEMGEGC